MEAEMGERERIRKLASIDEKLRLLAVRREAATGPLREMIDRELGILTSRRNALEPRP